jgi:hypothetical protein
MINEIQNQLGHLASSPESENIQGQQPVSGLEGQQPGQQGASYPNQQKVCILLKLMNGAQN